MAGIAFARKLVATTVAAVACGGVAWASAAMAPAPGAPHRADAVSETTVDSESSTTTNAGASTTTIDNSTTTTIEADNTTSTDVTTTSSEPQTTTTVSGPKSTAPCNHGDDVSRVAHTAPRGHDGLPGAHGAAVSTVAHQKCANPGDNEKDPQSVLAPRAHTPSQSTHVHSHKHVKIRSGRLDS
ncbi:MAG: hypothetical protein JWM72_4246 [Actinomycetia bacterium]|nr:hypothetical protein [Actinomycetes bacterium]